MSLYVRGGLLFGGLTLLAVACAQKSPPPGELVVVVTSDMSVPKDIDSVRVQVLSGSQTRTDTTVPIGAGGVLLPATLGILAGSDPSVPATIRVIGIGAHRALTLREATVTVPVNRTAMLRMPIEWLCVGSAVDPTAVDPSMDAVTSACPAGETCVAGACVSDAIDSAALTSYAEDPTVPPADGGAGCFDTTACFDAAIVEPVSPSTCTVPVPPGADPSRLNVALEPADGAGICDGTGCFVPLDQDASDGWTVSGGVVSLPAGLCSSMKAGLRATIAVSTACPSKTPELPECGPWSRGGPATISNPAEAGASDGSPRTDGSPTSDASVQDAPAQDTGLPCPAACASGQVCVDSACVPAVTTTGTSCQATGPGLSNCGPGGSESCCASLAVPAGSAKPACASGPVKVSGARLDKYEATVGRFRQFLAATRNGWLPQAGSGKHDHVNGGQGLVSADDADGGPAYESGWDSSWNSPLTASLDAWSTYTSNGSFTSSPAANENLPMLGLTWYEAYAFCIWDGGFLPSTSEWQVAASGGEGRTYPWSSPASSTTIDCSYADYFGGSAGMSCVPTGGDTVNICQGTGCQPNPTNPNDVGSESPKGDGKWGHADMAGNAVEWNLDTWGTLSACTDCANLGVGVTQRNQGGGFFNPAPGQVVSNCSGLDPSRNGMEMGVRCARMP